MELAGARVLITHTLVQPIIGSTMVALDVATELRRAGAEVTVFTAIAGDPAAAYFSERDIPLEIGLGESLHLADYDYVWVHSQVLPLGFIEELGTDAARRAPAFIFNHMSAVEYAPDEFPYLDGMEEEISSLSLYVSEEAQAAVEPFFRVPPPGMIFANPAPRGFLALQSTPGPQLSRLLIVSNHRPAEVDSAAEMLAERGVVVSRLGTGGDQVERFTPTLLAGYDAVVTIGKTVQCCLVSGVPVFVYDHFGGPGYLGWENQELAAERNYSGRGFPQLSADELVTRLIGGYSDAREYQRSRQAEFAERYSMPSLLPAVFRSVRPRSLEPLPNNRVRALSAAQRFGARFYERWAIGDHLHEELSRVRAEQQEVGAQLRQAQADVAAERREVAALRSSWSFRIGSLIVRPAAFLVALVATFTARRASSGSDDL